MPAPHLLLYTDDAGDGGNAQYNHALLRALTQRNFKLTTVTSPAENPLLREQKSFGIHQLFLSFDSVKDFPKTLQNDADAHAFFTQSRPDLILFANNCPFSNFAAKRVARQLHIPYLVVEAFVAPYLAQNFAQFLPELAEHYRSARAVVAVSQENLLLLRKLFHLAPTAGQVIHYGRPDIFFTPPNPQTRARIRASLNIPDDAFVSITTARLESVKGYQYQLPALQLLQSSPHWPRMHFLWIGAGSLETELRAALRKLNLESHVHLLGQRWDIPDLLDAADLFLLPSQLEGMPLSIMEAMAKSLPVLASAVSGIPEELGNTGKLLTDPKTNPNATVSEIRDALHSLASDPALRTSLGQAAHARAKQLFHESRMIDRTLTAIDHTLLPPRDYVSPEFRIVRPDHAFPNMIRGDAANHPFPYLRREIPHNWYCDARDPMIGFASRDEAAILHNTALLFAGKPALEIGCWMGWSACHLALAGVQLDVIDPLLNHNVLRPSVEQSLTAMNVLQNVRLHPGSSPELVHQVAAQHPDKKWSLIFIDGNHDRPGPLNDTRAVLSYAADDAAILFHDLASPEVADALHYLRDHGWKTLLYQTMQIMAIAYRGNVTPPLHIPDPSIDWPLPAHLAGYPISGQPAPPPTTIQRHGETSTGGPIISFAKPSSLDILKSTLHNYARNPADAATIQSLDTARKNLIQQFLTAPPSSLESLYRSDPGQSLRLLRDSNFLPLAPPLPTPDSSAILSQLYPTHIPSLIAGMLAFEPYHLFANLTLDLTLIPNWLLPDFVIYLLKPPAFFRLEGQADTYARYLQTLFAYLAKNILENPASLLWPTTAELVTQHANFISAYFNHQNLRELYAHRAQIMSHYFSHVGVPLAHNPSPPPSPKIRLGILAEHFGPQTETYTTLPVYKHLPRDRFDITLFAIKTSNHPMQKFCADHADRFIALPKEIPAQLQTLRDANLDILWFATNVTAVTNLVAILALARIAPIQINSASSCTTSGMPHMDYYLSAKSCEPHPTENAQSQYTEKLLLIDGPAHCIDHATESAALPTTTFTRAAAKISPTEFVFASGANFFKIIPEVAHTWIKILANVPNSRLLLYPFNINWSPTYPVHAFMSHFASMMKSHNVDPARLSIFPPAPNLADVKERLKLADLYLDSFPFTGVNSLLDPLAIALPPLVMDGASFRSLMAASFMRELNLPELIAKDPTHYIQLATQLANDKPLRTELSHKIKSAMTAPTPPLFLNPRAYSEKISAILQSLKPKI